MTDSDLAFLAYCMLRQQTSSLTAAEIRRLRELGSDYRDRPDGGPR